MKNTILVLSLMLAACANERQHFVSVEGTPGTNGANGTNGTNGANGTNGTNGANGQDAKVTVIQFCPGTPIYPSVFPEVGFLINGHVYAVYSANGGFLTLIMPGIYNSNAVGSRCDFKLNADNTVELL